MNVVVIEDDRRIACVLRQSLSEDGHNVYVSHRGDEGLELIASEHFDLALLDLMLPGMDGFSILEELRTQKCKTPIMVLTAKDSPLDIVHGLDLGADDYLTKPFQLAVLLARVRAVGRRGFGAACNELKAGALTLNMGEWSARRGSHTIPLTHKEFILLELLMRRPNHIVRRAQLIEAGWGYDGDVRDNTIDFYIHSLRSKIDSKGEPSLIRTVRSVGYMLALPE
jgi:two-component system, OmpR family, copper resistance phosphate regulon response regulator CusR